jgi:hypothetical protein
VRAGVRAAREEEAGASRRVGSRPSLAREGESILPRIHARCRPQWSRAEKPTARGPSHPTRPRRASGVAGASLSQRVRATAPLERPSRAQNAAPSKSERRTLHGLPLITANVPFLRSPALIGTQCAAPASADSKVSSSDLRASGQWRDGWAGSEMGERSERQPAGGSGNGRRGKCRARARGGPRPRSLGKSQVNDDWGRIRLAISSKCFALLSIERTTIR